MAVYTSKQSVWDEALGEYKDYGFSIVDKGNVVGLYFKDKKIATLYSDKLTIDVLRDGCKNYLVNTR